MGILKVKDSEGNFVDIPALKGEKGDPGVFYTAGNDIEITADNVINYVGSSGDYEQITNKPQINNVELVGNKSLSDLGILTESEIDNKVSVKADTSYVNEQLLTKVSDSELNDALSGKADIANTYNKTEVDNSLAVKANTNDVYSKEEIKTLEVIITPVEDKLSYSINILKLPEDFTISNTQILSVSVMKDSDIHGKRIYPIIGEYMNDTIADFESFSIEMRDGTPIYINMNFTLTEYDNWAISYHIYITIAKITPEVVVPGSVT